jgi:ligand-binding sensor domain-containing protein
MVFLWIGTHVGLNRFDGSRFVNYFSNKSKDGMIISDYILALVEDSLNNIWIGTDMGLSRYDVKTDTFTNFSTSDDTLGITRYIKPFWATRDEVFCIEGSTRITSYNIHTFTKKIIAGYSEKNFEAEVNSILDTLTNSVWVLDKAGVSEISLTTGKKLFYSFTCNRKLKFPGYEHRSLGMCYDPKSKLIWLNTSDGLVQFNLETKKFYHLTAFDNIVNKKTSNQAFYYPYSGISLDREGRIWMATRPKGIFIYDPARNLITQPFSNVDQKNFSHDFTSFYCDRDGIIWVTGGGKAFYQFNPANTCTIVYSANSTKPSSLSYNSVATIVNGPQGKLWIGTWDGINIFDPATGLFQVLRENNLQGFKGKNIIPIAIDDSQKKTWLKAWYPDALFEMDIANRKCKKISLIDTTFNHRINLGDMESEAARPYKNGFIFPMQGEGIFLVERDSLVARQILTISQNISRIVIGNDHYLFIKTPNASKNITYTDHGKWILTPNPFDSIEWSNIFFNKEDQTWWVGGRREILHYDKNFNIIRRYADGFPGIDVLSMLADNNGNIWFVIRTGNISRLQPKSGKFLSLSEKDGFQKQNFSWQHASVKDTNGDLYFGSRDGLYRISPNKFVEDYPLSTVYVESINVNQKPFSKPISANNIQQLSLNYNENKITIETGIIDYYSEGSSQIRYKLEGLNENWQYGPANYIIRYVGLPPGKYKLIMQASNAVNEFIGSEKKLLILISPPYWYSWWFISSIAVIIILTINALFQFRLKQKTKVLAVRQKLHRDLHDDVGATLSSVKVYSEILQTNMNNPLIIELIKNNAAEMIDKLEIIAWATNPQHDTFKSFKELMHKYASPVCYAKNIHLNIQCFGVDDEMIMPGDIRQNLFLIFKEAINNTIKYSEASQCDVQTLIRNHKFYFQIKDNGKGLRETIKETGTGWKNIQKRVKELNGRITIESESNGTIIDITLHYPF